MPGSSISLESLSSPSPTPPPSPPRAKGSATHKAQAAQAKAAPPHGLGSDSELSELTEEEQDGVEKRTNPPNVPHGDRTATGDESAGGTSVGGGASTSTSASLSRRATQKVLSTAGKRRRGRKKRSSLVPAPMWDWAGTKAYKEQEEEEEEEMPGPPEVMEEEEDEEEGEVEEEDKEKGAGNHHPAPTSIVRKSKGKKVVGRTDIGRDEATEVDAPRKFETKLNGALALPRGIAGSGAGGNEEEEEEAESECDSEEDKNIQSHSDEASDSDGMKWTVEPIQMVSRTRGWLRRKTNPFPHPHRRAGWTNTYDYARVCQRDTWKLSEDDSGSSKGSDEEGVENEEDTENENEKDEGDIDKEDNDQDPPPEDVDPPKTMQVVGNYSNPIISSAALKATSSHPNSLARVVDQTGPLVEAIAPIAAAAAASSIMAGSQVIDPASPATSTFSRFHSPDPTSTKHVVDSLKRKNAKVQEQEGDYDGSLAVPKVEKKEKIIKHAPPALDLEVDPPELEGDGENEPSAAADADEPEAEQEQEVDVENELETVEAEEPSPDDDLEVELESDLQPAHRAEALDVLATIELKFALLRERVYVEKMEGLAWEEKLVNEGTHPELIHIQKELLKRRDRRLELASRKREYELVNISKRRRTNEDSTWSWWKLARDDLQTDMVAETSRKRRRLERERRTSEKPQPIPHVPMPPSEVPPAPSLRRIVKSFPFVDKQKTRNSQVIPKPGDYPELLGLTPSEINTDLEVFFSGRRGYDFRGNPVIGFPAPIAPPLGFPGYEGYPDHMGNPMVPPGRIHPQHVPSFTHQMHPPQGYAYPSPNSGRMPPPLGHGHNPLQPPPPPPLHAGPSGSGMYPMDEMMGPIPHPVPPHHYYGSQVNGGPYHEGAPLPATMAGPPGHHGRRSPSPMNAVVNGKQPHSVWIGPGVPPGAGAVSVGPGGYSGPGQGRPNREWIPGDDRRRDYPIGSEEEERERMVKEREQREERREFFDRERDKQREQREKERDRESMMMDMDRERHMQMMAQHRQGPPVSGPPPSAPLHPHAHGMPGQLPPMVGHHHSRPHHHHVVHHHHHHHGAPAGGPPPPASVMHSPRAPREYGEMGPGSGQGQYPTEVINLSSKHGPPPPHRDDFPSNHELDFREKETREKERARISRRSSPVPGSSSQSQSQIQGPLQPPLMEGDRPISTPFAMASTQTMQASSSVNGASSPRLSSTYDGHLTSPGHRFSSTGRSIPPTAGPSTPSAIHPPSLPSSTNRDGSTLSPSRRPLPPQSPPLISESLGEREPEGMGGSSSAASLVPSSSPILHGQKLPGPVKFGPPPPPSMILGSSTNVAERERGSGASSSGMSGAIGPFGAKSSSVGSKVRPGSPISQVAKAANNQPSVNSRVGLSGPGRAGTPVGPEKKGPFAFPSARSVNGAVGGFDGDEKDRDKEREKHKMLEEAKLLAGPGPLTPPTSLISSANASAPTSSPVVLTSPSKMSVPQMVDGP